MGKGEKVVVVGAGVMGHGIAQVAAVAGYEVDLVDVAEDSLRLGVERIRANLRKAVERADVQLNQAEADAALARIRTSTDLDERVADSDVIIEAVPEDLALKKDLVRRITASCPRTSLVATNTSGLSVTEIASVATGPERLVGMHFFNPPFIMKLVEIVRGYYTGPEAVARAEQIAARMGKETICVADSPGFATSRLSVVLGNEAMRIVESGVASCEDVDKAMEIGFRHPMGPLKVADLVGLDVRLAVADHLYDEFGAERYKAPQILRTLVRAGRLGRKTGSGFYEYSEPQKGPSKK